MNDLKHRIKNILKAHNSWLVLLFLTIILLVCMLILLGSLVEERKANEREAEFLRLGEDISQTSDYLSLMAREFAITGELKYLNSYWTEVYVTKTRENALERLKYLKTPASELNYLDEAKHNSDSLINTEVRSMKLILTAMGAPPETMHPDIKNYTLTPEDLHLSVNEKINTAQKILFDKKYADDKARIMDPINQFQTLMSKRVMEATVISRRWTDVIFSFTSFIAILILIVLLSMIWIRTETKAPYIKYLGANKHPPE